VPVLVFPSGGRRRRGDRAARPGQRVPGRCWPRGGSSSTRWTSVAGAGDGVEGLARWSHRLWLLGQFPRVRPVGGSCRPSHARPGRPGHRRDHQRRLDRRLQCGGGAVPVSRTCSARAIGMRRQLPDRAVLRRGLEPGPVLTPRRLQFLPGLGGRANWTGLRQRQVIPRVRGGRMGGHRRVVADGRGPRRQRASPNRVDNWGPQWGAPVGPPGARCSPSTSASSRRAEFLGDDLGAEARGTRCRSWRGPCARSGPSSRFRPGHLVAALTAEAALRPGARPSGPGG